MKTGNTPIIWMLIFGVSTSFVYGEPINAAKSVTLQEKVKYMVQRCAYLYDTTDDPNIEQYEKDIFAESDNVLPYIIDVFSNAKTPVYARFAVNLASHLHPSDKSDLRSFMRSIVSKSRYYRDEDDMVRQIAIVGFPQWGEGEDAIWLGNQATDPSLDGDLIFAMNGAIERMGDVKGLKAFRDSLKKRMAEKGFRTVDIGSQKAIEYAIKSTEETINKLEKATQAAHPGKNVGEHSANEGRKEVPGARMGANSSANSGNSRSWLIVLGLLAVSVVGIGAWILLSKKRNR